MARLRAWLKWATGWTLMALFYAHGILGIGTADITPIVSVVLAVLMTVTALLGLSRLRPSSAPTKFRRVALLLLVGAITVWIVSSVSHYLVRPPTVRDLGQFGIYCLIPILLLLNRERSQLITFVGRLCVIMTMADLVYNLFSIMGVLTPASAGGLLINGVWLARYGGISGNVLAAGQVALIGVVYSAWRTRCRAQKIPRLAWFAILALCVLGLHLAVARRYEVAAIIGAAVILAPWARLVPLSIYALMQAGAGLYVTFTSLESEEILRSRLMMAAASDLQAVFWFGRGAYFPGPVTTTNFLGMWAGGVTESGMLDLALAFGVPATGLFFAAVAFALLAKRVSVSWMPVLLTVLAGTFPFNNPLSFLGSVVFFGALLSVILQEVPDRRASHVRGHVPGLVMAPG